MTACSDGYGAPLPGVPSEVRPMVRRALMTAVATCAVALVLPGAAPAAKRTPASALSVGRDARATRSSRARRGAGGATRSSRRPTAPAPTAPGPGRATTPAASTARRPPTAATAPTSPRRGRRRPRAAALQPGLLRRGDGEHLPRLERRPGLEGRGEPGRQAAVRRPGDATRRSSSLSIGGNDLGFADIIRACAQAYAARTGPCRTSPAGRRRRQAPGRLPGVAKAIDEVRAVMAESGYRATDYRFIVQSYGSPVPRAAEARYTELDPQRSSVGGCPFYDTDLNWARDSLVEADRRRPALRRRGQGRRVPRPAQLAAGPRGLRDGGPPGDADRARRRRHERVGPLPDAQPRPGRDPGDAAPQRLRPAGALALPLARHRRGARQRELPADGGQGARRDDLHALGDAPGRGEEPERGLEPLTFALQGRCSTS